MPSDRLVTETLETLSVLKALRTAVEAVPVQGLSSLQALHTGFLTCCLTPDKRAKRQRMSPQVNQATAPARSSPPLIQAATRNAQATNGTASRQKKAALREGRMIAFRVPAIENRDASEAEWILARIIRTVDANNYIVQDAVQDAALPP